MSTATPTLRRQQTFPIFYPAEGRFTVDGTASTNPSGLQGAKAVLTFTINTRPHGFIGLRLRNVYPMPSAELVPPGPAYFPSWSDIKLLDHDQDVAINLAQQNVIVKRADQACVMGGGPGSPVWHPWACPYPFRGGNNVTVEVTRTVSYPLIVGADEQPVQGFFPVCKGVLVGYAYVSGKLEEGAPPASGWPDEGGS